MLSTVGIDQDTIMDADARIPLTKAVALLEEAQRITKDPALALHAAEMLQFGAYKVVDYLAFTRRTGGEGLEKLARYFPIVNAGAGFEVDDRDEHEIAFRLKSNHPGAAARTHAEYALSLVALRCGKAIGHPLPLARVEFAFAEPADTSEYERVFCCPVHFGMVHNQLVLPRPSWSTLTPQADPGIYELLEDHARSLLKALPVPHSFLDQVRIAVAEELRGGDLALDHIARKLGLSSRTLQRRLQEEDVTYAGLLDKARCEAAESYLRQEGIALCEVSHLLGFSDQSAFNRAFKRWTGATPRAYRLGRASARRATLPATRGT